MYDYVIVGGGSAGCVLAARLSEDPRARVLLLEAGPAHGGMNARIPAAWTKLFKTAVDWDYATEPQEAAGGRRLYWPRGKMLGGSSSMNAMMYVRGNRADYDEWARRGNAGWGWDDVLPYFRRAEDHQAAPSPDLGAGGPICVSALRHVSPLTRAFVRAAVEAGIPPTDDVNGARQEGVGLTPVTIRNGARCGTAAAYLRPARGRPNLAVLTGAHATRVLLEGGRAVGVEYVRQGRRETARASREVVLSGGAVNSPQLLMLSGVGPAAHLREHGIAVAHHLPGVGENLRDHLAVAVLYRCPLPVSMSSAETLPNLLRYLLLRRGPFASNVAEACAFLRASPDAPAPDLELIFAPVVYREHNLRPPARSDHGFTVGSVLLRPESAGRVTLRSAEWDAPPCIDPAYLSDPGGADARVLAEGIRWARRVAAGRALAPYRGDELEPGADVHDEAALDRYIRGRCETLYHPVGTCRMGTDEMAVVDPELRVRGVDALRVVDASVMPTIIRGHTNAPTIMIAEKAADLIRGAAPARIAVPGTIAAAEGAAAT